MGPATRESPKNGPDAFIGKSRSITSPDAARSRANVLTLLALAAVLAWRWWAYETPTAIGYDERIYTIYVRSMSEGLDAFQSKVSEFPTDNWLSVGPPPTRVSYLAAGVLAGSVFGGNGIAELAMLSAVCGFASLLVLALLLRRWMSPDLVSLAILLAGTAPLATALSRRALQETFVALFLFLAIWLVDRWVTARRATDYVLACVALAVACLAKESVYFLLPVIALTGCLRSPEPRLEMLLRLVVLCTVSVAIALGVMLWALGGAGMLTDAVRRIAEMPQAIDYAREYQVGAWYRYLVDLLLLAPLAAPLAMLSIAPTTFDGRRRDGTNAMLICLFLGCALLTLSPTLNVRQVLFAESFVHALSVIALVSVVGWTTGGGRLAKFALGAGIAVMLAINISQFHRYFIAGKIYDPVTDSLVRASRLVPK
jgi:4-amino-4-deoxy-L-arabinose transferase-like glycosyltransferase